MRDYKLSSNDSLTNEIKENKIYSWYQLLEYVRKLPYGRTSDRTDLKLVLIEKKGTCSSKHGFLKKVADLNNIPDLKLIIGIFRMNKNNTPKIGDELINNDLKYIPEAHCYIKTKDQVIDVTSESVAYERIKKNIIIEYEIESDQVGEYKVQLHKDFLKSWLTNQNLDIDFDRLWQIRENCIKNIEEG